MKRLLICIGLFLFAAASLPVNAQNIIDAGDDHNWNDFYDKGLVKGKKAMPYEFLRRSDVVWETAIWRTIDFREKFNQFFYFPLQTDQNTQGRINIVNAFMKAIEDGTIEVYEDDDMNIPMSWEKVKSSCLSTRYIDKEVGEDEFGDPIYEKQAVQEDFDPSMVYKMHLKEYWYIDKEDTRQKVRIVGLSFTYDRTKEVDGEEIPDPIDMFWVPMDDMRVRNYLACIDAYDENNNTLEKSYDQIFVSRYFDSYVTRETNRFNRGIADYLTGMDAIVESQGIEDKIFDIESDMWEY